MFIAANFDNFSIDVINTCHLFGCIKGLYPPNFEKTLKSMTCSHIESIHFDRFKNVKKKNSKQYHVTADYYDTEFYYLTTFDKQHRQYLQHLSFFKLFFMAFTVIGFRMFIRVLNFSIQHNHGQVIA